MGSLGPATVRSTSEATKAASASTMNNGAVAVADKQQQGRKNCSSSRAFHFQMPLHYPRYKKADYDTMPEWRVDCLLREYGLPVSSDLDGKGKLAVGAFLWPDQY